MSESSAVSRIQAIAERVAAEINVEVVHVEILGGDKRPAVRIIIDKPGGVTHADCSGISHHVGTVLDVEDFISSAYTLEVSSPGLERELYSLTDFAKYSGSLAKLKTRQPVNNQRNFRGRITGVSGENIIFDDKTNGIVEIPFELIVKANLEIDIEEEFKRSGNRPEEVE